VTPTTNGRNIPDALETIADAIPVALAQQQGIRAISWAEFARRSDHRTRQRKVGALQGTQGGSSSAR